MSDKETIIKYKEGIKETFSVLMRETRDDSHAERLNPLTNKLLEVNESADAYIKELNVIEQQRKAFKIDIFPLPKFDGDIRKYPRFKRDFTEFVRPQISPKQGSC